MPTFGFGMRSENDGGWFNIISSKSKVGFIVEDLRSDYTGKVRSRWGIAGIVEDDKETSPDYWSVIDRRNLDDNPKPCLSG